jgi:hypothetical protein
VRELVGRVFRRVGLLQVGWSCLAALGLAAQVRAGGNVTVRVDHDRNLIVEGDGADNEIRISPVAIGVGEVVGIGSTLVNGSDRASFRAVDGDFRIRMRGGDDRVSIVDGDGNHVPDDLDIDTGHGDDHVLLQGFFVHDDLRIRSGPGDDTIELSQTVFVQDRSNLHTGSGNDQVLFRPADVANLLIVFEDDFQLRTGSGRDFVSIEGVLFRGGVDIDLNGGDDLGESGGIVGGLCVCGSSFETADVLADVRFGGGGGMDGVVLESVCGIAPPGLLQDFLRDFEVNPDDCSFLGGAACARGCE